VLEREDESVAFVFEFFRPILLAPFQTDGVLEREDESVAFVFEFFRPILLAPFRFITCFNIRPRARASMHVGDSMLDPYLGCARLYI
jgi:hypothetical protein